MHTYEFAFATFQTGMPTYSATSGEADIYGSGCQMLTAAGVDLPPPQKVLRSGIEIDDHPRVVIDPSFGVTLAQWRAKLPMPGNIKLAAGSTLVLKGDLQGLIIESLELKGALVVSVAPGAKVTLRKVQEKNAGWAFKELGADDKVAEPLAIRGYDIEKLAHRQLTFNQPGYFVVDDTPQCSLL